MGRSGALFAILGAVPFLVHCEEVEMESLASMEADDEHEHEMDMADEHEMEMADPDADEGAYDGMNLISDEQLKALFKLVDKDGDGKVKVSDLVDLHQARGKSLAQRDSRHIFESMDIDRDGKVSLAEMHGFDADGELDAETKKHVEFSTAQFKVADVNGDGFLSEEEALSVAYPELHAGMLEFRASHSLKNFDSNGDGTVDLDEFSHKGGADAVDEDEVEFKALDKNRDGKLDTEEFKVHEQLLHHVEIAMQELMTAADQDADGAITLDELLHARAMIPGTNAQYHFEDFVEHYEL